uniref:Myelin protein zero-like protein 2 n=1 Tax=Cyprinodon variegatus TaxID=28743 RepID=A0A3Q2D462_CYPVA
MNQLLFLNGLAVSLHVTFLSALAGVLQVNGIRIYTSEEVDAVNGTDTRLKCTFESSSRPHTFNPHSIFYYLTRPYPIDHGIFKKRISWAGDIMGGDASIIIRQVKFAYNGTYTCQVTNPPDVHGHFGEIKFRPGSAEGFFLLKGSFSSPLSLQACLV